MNNEKVQPFDSQIHSALSWLAETEFSLSGSSLCYVQLRASASESSECEWSYGPSLLDATRKRRGGGGGA